MSIKLNGIDMIKMGLHQLGIDIHRYPPSLPPDIDPEVIQTIHRVKDFTMTSPERISALCEAVKYVVKHQIPGDMVECGVWKGGSMMAIADTLKKLDREDRELYLFDTFTGMSEPTEKDVDLTGLEAQKLLQEQDKTMSDSVWCYATLADVRKAVGSIEYPASKIHFVKGKVEETIPDQAPEKIALLRLDTDWYESTKHELIHLFPRISAGGVIIIDDYGHWQGARKAVDEYLTEHQIALMLNRIDVTARMGIVYPLSSYSS
jgi:hypothetical protein